MSESLLCSALDHLRGHTHCFVQSVQWSRLQQRCFAEHHLHWAVDAWYAGVAEAWLAEMRQLLRSTRSSIHTEQRRMLRERKPPADSNPAAFVHRILRSDALPAQLLSVVNKDGQLTSTAEELKEVMADRFRSVFSVPPADAAPLPHPVPAMLLDKAAVQAEWYDGLMRDVEGGELLAVMTDTPLVSAPGEDEVSSGLWKLALDRCEELRALVAALFTACLRSSTFPAAWKTSIIVPLLKDASKERSMIER